MLENKEQCFEFCFHCFLGQEPSDNLCLFLEICAAVLQVLRRSFCDYEN